MKFSEKNIGQAFSINNGEGSYYFAVFCNGGDFLFSDMVSKVPEIASLDDNYFLRLFVSYPSIKRAGWKRLNIRVDSGSHLKSAPYLQTPVGGDPMVFNPVDGSSRPARDSDLNLEDMAIWDAEFHILPILNYHFLGRETPIRSSIRSSKL